MFDVLKKIFVLLSFFLLISCDSKSGESTTATGGVATPQQQLIFSKTCPAGSVNVHHTPSTLTTAGTVTLGQLPVGAKVSISGTITSGGCGQTGPLTFTCSAVVQITNNRAYVCESGTISSSILTASAQTVTAGQSPVAPGIVPQPRSFVGGYFMVFNNGTSLFGRIELGPSQWIQTNCPISFNCGVGQAPSLAF